MCYYTLTTEVRVTSGEGIYPCNVLFYTLTKEVRVTSGERIHPQRLLGETQSAEPEAGMFLILVNERDPPPKKNG